MCVCIDVCVWGGRWGGGGRGATRCEGVGCCIGTGWRGEQNRRGWVVAAAAVVVAKAGQL